MKTLILAVLSTWVAVGFVTPRPFQFNPTTKKEEANTQHSNQETKKPISLPNNAKTPDTKNKTDEVASEGEPKSVRITELPPNDTWYKAYVIATIALLAVGISGIVMACKTLKFIKAQTAIARVSASASQQSMRVLINSERAWVMTEIQWEEKGWVGNIHKGEESVYFSGFLMCKNDGSSPAWITEMFARMIVADIDGYPKKPDFSSPIVIGYDFLGAVVEPLTVGKEHKFPIELRCSGKLVYPKIAIIYGYVRYADIFKEERYTGFGYTVGKDNMLCRIPIGGDTAEYNRYT
jgi:hypothetical protein